MLRSRRVNGSLRLTCASAIASTPNGIIMKKIQRHEVLSTIAPPTNGPSTVAMP